jgi:deoxyribodipyrimidine photolyase-like uncharacterized protein
MFIANIDGKEIELSADSIKPKQDGYAIVTPESVPDGFYTEEAVQKRIKDRLKNTASNARSELENDESFHKQILSKYNISIGEDGKPKGLKPDFDPDEWKQKKAKELTKPYEEKLREKDEQLNSFKNGLVRAELLKAANGRFKEDFIKSYTGNDDPFVVKQFADLFDVDESGNVAMRDKDGTFAVTGDGSRITPETFFEQNREKFSNLMQDKRQTGSGFKGGSNGSSKTFSKEEISRMSPDEYAKNREAILATLKEK